MWGDVLVTRLGGAVVKARDSIWKFEYSNSGDLIQVGENNSVRHPSRVNKISTSL